MVLSRHDDVGVGTASAGHLERVSLASLVCLGRLQEEFDSSDRGAACQPEFAPPCTVPNGVRQSQKMGIMSKGSSIR